MVGTLQPVRNPESMAPGSRVESGDETRTRALGLGSCEHFAAGLGADLGKRPDFGIVGGACFAVIPCCSPLDLVCLWCGLSRS